MAYEERKDGMTIGEKGFTVRGAMLNPGDAAPDFTLVANNFRLKRLSDYDGKVKILSIVPSLDTKVCSTQTRRFNQEASHLSEDIVILTISADLPYAQKRWCGAEGIERVETLSDHREMKFADDYGVHVTDLRITQRAVLVLDKDNQVVHAEYKVPMGEEVNFEAALKAASTAATR